MNIPLNFNIILSALPKIEAYLNLPTTENVDALMFRSTNATG